LIEAGYDTISRTPPPLPNLACGATWDPVCRALYRRAIRCDIDLDDPLDGRAFLAWAAGSDDGDHLVRYLRTLMTLRGDVSIAFDEGRDTVGLAAWLRTSGRRELGIDPALLEQIVGAASRASSSVNYVGYFRAHLGVAEAARNSVQALTSAGVGVTAIDITASASSPEGAYVFDAAASGTMQSTISILGCNADMLPSVLAKLPAKVQHTYRIGCWYWEAPEFPDEWCDRFDMVDEVWAATRFIAEAIRAKATVPVVVVPVMVDPPKVTRNRAWLATLVPEIMPDEFVFLFQFDVRSVPFRKNPEGAIAAFLRAFTPDEPVRLVIKMLNADDDPGLLARLSRVATGHRVSFMDQTLESTDRFRLLASVDSFVSLHRAEGLGLSIAEAMAYGLPVVVTDWSGNVDFTSAENAALVGYDLVPTKAPHGPYPAGTVWAEPRIAEAAHQMRRVVDDPAWRKAIGSAAARTVATDLSAEAVGTAMRTRLERLATSARVSRMALSRWVGGAALLPTTEASGGRTRRGALATVAADVINYPAYYASRLPRLPRLLYENGVQGFLSRVAVVARDSHEIKKTTRLPFTLGRGKTPAGKQVTTNSLLQRILEKFFRFSA
jgi:glycosyltransferase involved in cell wall biosynthesis